MGKAGADIQFRRHSRLDVCLVLNHNIALYVAILASGTEYSNLISTISVFLPAADIPSFVGKGNVDLGITGHDVILEAKMEEHVTEVLPLGFGKCALQVQVPEHGPIKDVKDLAGKRVVTSFEVLAGQYFSKVDDELGLEGAKKTQIEYVGGSVEAACALGLADGIGTWHVLLFNKPCLIVCSRSCRQVHSALLIMQIITSASESGDTMRAAGLHAIATVLPTEAVLIKSSKPKHEVFAPLIEVITQRIAGFIASKRFVLCQYNIRRGKLASCTAVTPGRRAATVSPLEDGDWVAVSSMVETKSVADVMDRLVSLGAEDILILKLENTRV